MQESQRARIRDPGTTDVTNRTTAYIGVAVNRNKARNRKDPTDCCEAPNCLTSESLRLIKHEDRPDVLLCRYHRKQYMGVTSRERTAAPHTNQLPKSPKNGHPNWEPLK